MKVGDIFDFGSGQKLARGRESVASAKRALSLVSGRKPSIGFRLLRGVRQLAKTLKVNKAKINNAKSTVPESTAKSNARESQF